MLWLLFNGDGLTCIIELNDTESLRIVNIVSEYCGALLFCGSTSEKSLEAVA